MFAATVPATIGGRIAWGAFSGLFGNGVSQGYDYATGARQCLSTEEILWAGGLGGIAGGLSKVKGINSGKTSSGANNYLARVASTMNSGYQPHAATNINYVLGHSPWFLQEPVPQAILGAKTWC